MYEMHKPCTAKHGPPNGGRPHLGSHSINMALLTEGRRVCR